MTTRPMNRFIQHFRRMILQRERAALTDGQLLENFVCRREAAALEVLMGRHALMVWNVCRRVLHHCHDAEDAFQATFLVLVRRASTIMPREMVANWLYGVAHQTALKARATVAKRAVREKQHATMPEPVATEPSLWPELVPWLDRELSRLSAKYRSVVVLCDLEGKSRKEAARQLGLPEGTIASRLARARTLLAERLTRRGVTVTAGVLAVALPQNAASAAVPMSILLSATQSLTLVAASSAVGASALSVQVAALSQGVLQAMFLTKLKLAAGLLVTVGLLGSGIAVLSSYLPTSTASAQSKDPKDTPPSKADIDEWLKKKWSNIEIEQLKKQLAVQQAMIEQLKMQLDSERVRRGKANDIDLLNQAREKELVEEQYRKLIEEQQRKLDNARVVKEAARNVEVVLAKLNDALGDNKASLAALEEIESVVKKMKEAKLKEQPNAAPVKPTEKIQEKPTTYRDIIGTVQKVNDGQVLISIGSDAGIKVGETLEVFRVTPKPTYCGRIKIVAVKPGESVGVVVGKSPEAIRPSDHVAVTKTIGLETPIPEKSAPKLKEDVSNTNHNILAISPDNKRMATEAGDSILTVWDLASMKVLWKMRGQKPLESASYSKDGKVLTVIDSAKDLWVIDAETGKQLEKR